MNNIHFTLMGEPIKMGADVVSVEKTSNSIIIEYEDGSFDKWMGYSTKLDILEIIANVAIESYRLGKYIKSVEEVKYLSDILGRLNSTK